MLIIVGLGNPGKKYKNTWHNLGFLVLEEFKERNTFPDFKLSKRFKAELSEKKLIDKKTILVKPQTFMNSSGQSVKSLIDFYKIKNLKNTWVIHDDLDLSFGEIKISKKRGAAGHKGVQSIIDKLKTKDFIRFRIGIKPKKGKPEDTRKFVLQEFKEEKETIKKIIKKTTEAVEFYIKEGADKAMAKFN